MVSNANLINNFLKQLIKLARIQTQHFGTRSSPIDQLDLAILHSYYEDFRIKKMEFKSKIHVGILR